MDVTGITPLAPRALVLAAGAGSRMGGPKVFAEIHGKSFGFHIASTLAQMGWPATWVLRGKNQIPSVSAWPHAAEISFVLNPEGDMFSSIVAGLRSRAPAEDVFCLWPADFPLVQPETLRLLALAIASGHDAAMPVEESGAGGHPLLVRRHVLVRWITLLPAGGLREAIGRLSCRLARVVAPDPACFWNLNTPDAVRRFELMEK